MLESLLDNTPSLAVAFLFVNLPRMMPALIRQALVSSKAKGIEIKILVIPEDEIKPIVVQ